MDITKHIDHHPSVMETFYGYVIQVYTQPNLNQKDMAYYRHDVLDGLVTPVLVDKVYLADVFPDRESANAHLDGISTHFPVCEGVLICPVNENRQQIRAHWCKGWWNTVRIVDGTTVRGREEPTGQMVDMSHYVQVYSIPLNPVGESAC